MTDIFYGGGRVGLSAYDLYAQLMTDAGEAPLPLDEWLARPQAVADGAAARADTAAETAETAAQNAIAAAVVAQEGAAPLAAAAQQARDAAIGAKGDSEDAAAASLASRDEAADFAALAAVAATAATAAGNIYPNTAAGLAATVEGGYFSALPPDGTTGVFATLYREVAGVAVEIARYPSKAAYDALSALIAPRTDTQTAIRDADGFGPAIFGIDSQIGSLGIGDRIDAAFALTNRAGHGALLDLAGLLLPGVEIADRADGATLLSSLAKFASLSVDADGALDVAGMTLAEHAERTAMTNRAGFARFWADGQGTFVEDIEIRPSGRFAIYNRAGFGSLLIDEDGLLIDGVGGDDDDDTPPPESLPDDRPVLTPAGGVLCGVAGEPLTLYVRNILRSRSDTARVVADLVPGAGLPLAWATDRIVVPDMAAIGSTATLLTRPEAGDASVRRALPMLIRTAAKYAVGTGPQKNILAIQDSIGNRQGGYFVDQWLTGWGYRPNWIGTVRCSASPTNDNAETGPLGEWREGHETGDATNAMTNVTQLVAPGDEAAYLAMSKTAKRGNIPWLRVSTGDDDPAIVRNGAVADFAFYQSRFSLLTPEVILYGYGTNDVRDKAAGQIYETVYDNDVLLLGRILAAWPSAKIIRFVPGTARNTVRDPLWRDEYVPLIEAMMDARAAVSASQITIAPVWGLVTAESGYATAASETDARTGLQTVTLSDPIHPIGHTRLELMRAIAGYVACAMDGTI